MDNTVWDLPTVDCVSLTVGGERQIVVGCVVHHKVVVPLLGLAECVLLGCVMSALLDS